MWKKFKQQLVEKWITPKEKERLVSQLVNQKVAEELSRMDLFEPLMLKYHGVFSEMFEYPEEKMSEMDKKQMYMMGWRLRDDKYFNFLLNFIMDTSGNELLRHDITMDKVFFHRAEIANALILKVQVGRLASLYEEILGKKGQDLIVLPRLNNYKLIKQIT